MRLRNISNMAKSKLLLFIYLMFELFSFTNCQISKLGSHYVDKNSYETKHDLSLFNNGSFQYTIKEGLLYDTISGNWEFLRNKQIILKPWKMENYRIESKCDTCAGKFYIKTFALPDKDEIKKPSVKVYYDGAVLDTGINNNPEDVRIQNADSIQINYLGFEPYMFTPQNRNDVIVNIFLIEEQQRLLQRDIILKIKKNKLVSDEGLIFYQSEEIFFRSRDIKVIWSDRTVLESFNLRKCVLNNSDTIILLSKKENEGIFFCDSLVKASLISTIQDKLSYRLYANDIYINNILIFPKTTKVYFTETVMNKEKKGLKMKLNKL